MYLPLAAARSRANSAAAVSGVMMIGARYDNNRCMTHSGGYIRGVPFHYVNTRVLQVS